MRATPNIKISKPDKNRVFTMTAPDAPEGDDYWFAVAVMAAVSLDVMLESQTHPGPGRLQISDRLFNETPSVSFAPTPSFRTDSHKVAIEALKDALGVFIDAAEDDAPAAEPEPEALPFDLDALEHTQPAAADKENTK